MHFHYMTYIATTQHKNLYPGGHEIYNFGRPFFSHHCYTLILFEPCLVVEKNFFLTEIHQCYTFYPKITSPWGVGGGVMKFRTSCLLTLQMLHTKFGKIGPVVLNLHRTQPTTKSHLSHSGDLYKMNKIIPVVNSIILQCKAVECNISCDCIYNPILIGTNA